MNLFDQNGANVPGQGKLLLGIRRLKALPLLLLVLPALSASPATPLKANDLLIVHCSLPGQVRQLGNRITYLSARRPIQTTAFDCRVRGGEYVSSDRANLSSALKIWLEKAQQGDAEAQTIVGELFERGHGVPADHAMAATWYQKAVAQNFSRAQINLGNLYERGLGVAQDSNRALDYYRAAAGVAADTELAIAAEPTVDLAPLAIAQRQRLNELQTEFQNLESTNQALLTELKSQQRAGQEQATLLSSLDQLERRLKEREDALKALQQRFNLQLRNNDKKLLQTKVNTAQEELRAKDEVLATQMVRIETLVQELSAISKEVEARELSNTKSTSQQAGPSINLIEPVMTNQTRGLVKVNLAQGIKSRQLVGRVDAPAGLLMVNINDIEATVSANGLFQATIATPLPSNPVKIVAIDQLGQRSEVLFELSTLPGSENGASDNGHDDAAFGNYYALLIGNAAYTNLPKLNTPVADVTQVAKALRQRYGFKTKVLTNATRYQMLSAFNELRAQLTSADNLILYYAGHGEIDKTNMRGHWLPVDAEADSTANWLSNVDVTDIMNVIAAKQVLLVVDSCYSGTLTRSSLTRLQTGLTEAERKTWLALISKKRARVVLASGGLAPVLDAGGGKHSVFAQAFLETLERNDAPIPGRDLHQAVVARVAHVAAEYNIEQIPEYAPISRAGHEAGDFVLVPQPH